MRCALWCYEVVAAGRPDPLPSVGQVIGLDEVPDALAARRSDGPPRIVVHPNGDTP